MEQSQGQAGALAAIKALWIISRPLAAALALRGSLKHSLKRLCISSSSPTDLCRDSFGVTLPSISFQTACCFIFSLLPCLVAGWLPGCAPPCYLPPSRALVLGLCLNCCHPLDLERRGHKARGASFALSVLGPAVIFWTQVPPGCWAGRVTLLSPTPGFSHLPYVQPQLWTGHRAVCQHEEWGLSVCLSAGTTLCAAAMGVSVPACVCVGTLLPPSSGLALFYLYFPLSKVFRARNQPRMLLSAQKGAAAAWGSCPCTARAPGTSLGGGILQPMP